MKELIKKLIRIGIVSLSGDDLGNGPLQQVSYRGKGGNGTAWYPYGFHAVAKENSYTLIMLPSANSEERVHIPSSLLERPNGEPGDVFVYHPDTGAEIKFDSSGKITITGVSDVAVVSPTKVTVDSPSIEHIGDETIDGTLGVTGDVTVDSNLDVTGDLNHDGVNLGFYGNAPVPKVTIDTINDGNLQALEDLLNALHSLGIINDVQNPR